MAVTTTRKVLREAIADQLGLLINTTIDTDTDPVFTINELADLTPDAEKMRDAYLYQSGVFRRVLTFGYPSNNNVTVTRTSAITTGAAQIYFLLSPTELDGAINETLQELYFEKKDSITLLDDTKDYALPAAIQKKSQVLAVKWQDETVSTNLKEDHVQGYRIDESANTCTLIVYDLLRDITTFNIQVYSRQMYSTLSTDAATTTCPYPLIFACATLKVLQKIFNKYGKAMNQLYGPRIRVAEMEVMKAKSDWLPKAVAREYIEEEQWAGPDSNEFFEMPSW